MSEREVRVRTADGEMLASVVHPDSGGPFPVAMVYMDGVGYREQVKANARRFAAAGYYCVAPDLYYRAGDRISFDMTDMEGERDRMLAVAATVKPDKVAADTRAVLDAIAADPAAAAGPKVCVGYCMGARMVLHIMSVLPDEFVAGAGIHPGALLTDAPDSPHHDLAGVRGEVYFAFAEIDRTATASNVDQFREELARQGVRGEVERLPGVTHGFAMADLPVYDRHAAERHFERTLELWQRQ